MKDQPDLSSKASVSDWYWTADARSVNSTDLAAPLVVMTRRTRGGVVPGSRVIVRRSSLPSPRANVQVRASMVGVSESAGELARANADVCNHEL